MNIEMGCSRMIWTNRERFFQRGNNLSRIFLWRHTICFPVIPGLKVHQRIGIKHKDMSIICMLRGDFLHAGRPFLIESGAVGCRPSTVARSKRVNQGLFFLGDLATQGLRLPDRFICGPYRVIMHDIVDIRSAHKGFTPIGHREIGIYLCASRNDRKASA